MYLFVFFSPQPVPVPDDQLPVVLPSSVELHGRGGSPLAKLEDWVNTTCPKCVPRRHPADRLCSRHAFVVLPYGQSLLMARQLYYPKQYPGMQGGGGGVSVLDG